VAQRNVSVKNALRGPEIRKPRGNRQKATAAPPAGRGKNMHIGLATLTI
jgi:hypothetical protein